MKNGKKFKIKADKIKKVISRSGVRVSLPARKSFIKCGERHTQQQGVGHNGKGTCTDSAGVKAWTWARPQPQFTVMSL